MSNYMLIAVKKIHFPRGIANLQSCSMTVKRRDPNPGVPCSKPPGGSKVDSAFHPPEVDKMSTRNFWELSGKK